MAATGLDQQVEAIVSQLVERFNLAISIAVDEKKEFAEAEGVFRDTLAVLEYYDCADIVAEQLFNFSQVAFFRKEYEKALYYAGEAVEKSGSEEMSRKTKENLHGMAYRIFEMLLIESEDVMGKIGMDTIEECLAPEDYCLALQNVGGAAKHVKTKEEEDMLAGIVKRLSMETMRQGLRHEKKGDSRGALLLFRTVVPFLNQKRATLISDEIKKLEKVCYG